MTATRKSKEWHYRYTSAAQARAKSPGTDGGGASGFVLQKNGEFLMGVEQSDIIAFMPHNRDVSKDEEQLANVKLLAAAPKMLKALALYLDDCELEGLDYNTDTYEAARAAISEVALDKRVERLFECSSNKQYESKRI